MAWDYAERGINWADSENPEFVSYCAGNRQSPINIKRDETVQLGPNDLPRLRTTCGEVIGNFKNDGHTLKFENPDGKALVSETEYMSGGPLGSSKYFFLQFHLHWGFYDCDGSEHTIDLNR